MNMGYASNKIKAELDAELKYIEEDILQICDLKDVDVKKEIKLYFKNL
jgi:hypothetical protein